MTARVEWAIRWAEPAPGLLDVSQPFDTWREAHLKLAESAFDGEVVHRTVLTGDWVSEEPSEIHEPFTDDGVTYCGWDRHQGCGEVWPCSTVRGEATR